jgi:hypothetical protein
MQTLCAGLFLLGGALYILQGIKTLTSRKYTSFDRSGRPTEILRGTKADIIGYLALTSGGIIFVSALTYLLKIKTPLPSPVAALFLCVTPLNLLAILSYGIVSRWER